jgi:hypothetical protein
MEPRLARQRITNLGCHRAPRVNSRAATGARADRARSAVDPCLDSTQNTHYHVMSLLATLCTLALSSFAMAAPFVVSDPVAVGVTQCGVYVDSASRVTSIVIAAMGSNICQYDLAGVATGEHLVAMTAITVNDPVWGSRESAKSSPLAFSIPVTPNVNFQGLWWNSPAGSESGWGVNFAHQGDTIFATWFTYDTSGNPWWLAMIAQKTSINTFSGTLYQTRGMTLDAVPFSPAGVTETPVGFGSLTFTDSNNGTFAYTVNGVSQNKAITREVFGPAPTCIFETQPDLALAANFQDLWWAAPAGSESGWGVSLTHQGNTIFATWFTYNGDGAPLWLAVTALQTSPDTYSGTLYRTTGPAFNAVPFNSASVLGTTVGTATFRFSDGNNATFSYTVNTPNGAITQSKQITREAFALPRTVCL